MPTFFSLSNLSLLFLYFSILLNHHSFALQQPLCRDDDRSLLLQFKDSFVFDKFCCDPSANYTKLSSWKVGDDCCSWDGVMCDDETGHVIGLDLSSSCLHGSMDSASPLFRLVHLTHLNLSYNNFNLSRIPGKIKNLSELTHLNFTSANFTGQIPSEILELSKLVSLDLSVNPLILLKPGLKDIVETFTHLAELHLSNVTISSPVPHSLSNLTSLSSLHLENCSLAGEFPSGIFRLPNLRLLNLRDNPNVTGCLPEFDQVGSRLQMLKLDGTNFSGQLPLSLENMVSLRVFTAMGCRFGGVIPSSIGNLTNLIGLDLSRNFFTGRIPSSLGSLFQLKLLSLSYNNFTSSTLQWLSRLTNLQILGVTETNSYGPIPSSFQNLTRLVELQLSTNHLTGQLPSWMDNFTQLTLLSLSFNELQGPIPDSIFRVPNIETIRLNSNNLSGTLEMDSFLRSRYLSSLRLSNNHLSLVSPTYTNVTLPKFRFIGLGGCNLSEFPAFLREQHELEALELNENNIKGYVPNWLFNLKRLIVLCMHNNFLTGFEHSPGVTLRLTNLNILDLAFNEFEGPLPTPQPSISFYDVSGNKFNGDVSLSFCNLTSLSVLDLSSNNLTGNLPPCLANLGKSATVLNLRNNTLSGEIPDSFTSSCALKVIDCTLVVRKLFNARNPQSREKSDE